LQLLDYMFWSFTTPCFFFKSVIAVGNYEQKISICRVVIVQIYLTLLTK